MEQQHFNRGFVFGITLVAAMGGLLFGYDWVVIGGAKPFYERFFQIAGSPHLQGWAMSSALIGCLAGALISGYLTDRFGRKRPLMLSALIFAIAAIGTGAANSFTLFILFRLFGGLGIGIASAVSPMYIAEISPPSLRGRLVSVNQLTIVIGILLAQVINFLIADPVHAGASDSSILLTWNGQTGWRLMFQAVAVPAFLFLVLSFFIPESPRFLAKLGKWDQAERILKRIGGKQFALQGRTEIAQTLAEAGTKVNVRELLAPGIRPLIILGIVLAVFQQWCGINVIFNYAEEVFSAAGYSVSDMLFNVVITGAINLIFTLISMRMVDHWGRRNLMLTGSFGLATVYLLLGAGYFFHIKGIAILILVLVALATYAMTLAPVTWVILSEIFPNKIRGAAMATATTALWMACFLLTYTFPFLNKWLMASGTFWLYALICMAGFVFILKKVPETKGKSLEEIEIKLTGK